MKRILFILVLFTSVSELPGFSQTSPTDVFSDFQPKIMKKERVAEVAQWRVPWDSGFSITGNEGRLLVGNLEYTAKFDTMGNMTEEGIYLVEGNKSSPYHYFYYFRDETGKLVKTHYLFASNRVDTNLNRVYHRYYDSRHRPHHDMVFSVNSVGVENAQPDDSIHFEYDFLGRMSAKVIYHAIPGDMSGRRLLEIYSYRYFYNIDGLLSTEAWEDFDTVYQKTKWKYDELGRRVSEEQYIAAAFEPSVRRTFEYPENRKIIRETIATPPLPSSTERTQEWFFDEKGKVLGYIEKSGEGAEPLCYVYRYTYYE